MHVRSVAMKSARRHTIRIVAFVVALAIASACSDDGNEPAAPRPSTTAPTGSTVAPQPAYRLDDTLRLNHIQVLGSHNSYHSPPYPEVLDALRGVNPATAAGLDYGHRPLREQFDVGVRQIELDVWSDPDGGKFANPTLLESLDLPPPDPAVMHEPGFKVIHEANIDTRSNCLTFVLCLRAVKTWSDAHPGHVPIMIEVEMKDATDDVTPATFDALEAEIRSVFDTDELVTPDDVRGDDPSLGNAVRTRGWPTLGEVRGRVIFTLDNESLAAVARRGHPSLRGRLLFTPSAPGEGDAAFAKLNDPIEDAAMIEAALAANMLVRTRADADTVQARSGDAAMRDAALAGGAQFVSTDYEVPDPRFPRYEVRVPGGTPARCNPVTAPPDCRSADVEDPQLLATAP
jgi:hypothetical protein